MPRLQQPHVLSNLQSVLLHAAPTVPAFTAQYDDLDTPSTTAGSYFTLQDLWQSYEAWSAYGCEVPMRINVDGVWQEIIQCYTPYLSGIQLFGADHTRRISTSSSSAAMSSYCSEDEESGESVVGGCAGNSCSSAYTSSTASTASTASDSDSEELCKDSPTCAAAPAAFRATAAPAPQASAAARRLQRHAERGSVLQKQHYLGEPTEALFEFMELERPHLRLPLHDQIMELAEQHPQLLTLETRDLHPTSWFAVTWVPIYRVPSVPDPAASRDLQANFLTFHSLAMPAQRLHSAPQDLCSIAPLPPLLDPIGAAAVAWRTEVARQHLLANALSALAAQQQQHVQRKAAPDADSPSSSNGASCSSAASAVSAVASQLAAASLDGGNSSKPAQLPLTAACLRPFAFMPYKASGGTWIDDWNLQRQHLPMIAAAGSWIERRKVQLPDFEFMSQMYRPLPTSFRGGR